MCAACRGDDVEGQQLAVERLERLGLDLRLAQLQAAADVEAAQRGAAAAQLLDGGVGEARAAREPDLAQARPVDVGVGEVVAVGQVHLGTEV